MTTQQPPDSADTSSQPPEPTEAELLDAFEQAHRAREIARERAIRLMDEAKRRLAAPDEARDEQPPAAPPD
jgi:hypothetical protein